TREHSPSSPSHTCYRLPPLFLPRSGHHRDLHSFPTRRSSDLGVDGTSMSKGGPRSGNHGFRSGERSDTTSDSRAMTTSSDASSRSEEHTSELQSRGHLVCRLLLEKKKLTATHNPPTTPHRELL